MCQVGGVGEWKEGIRAKARLLGEGFPQRPKTPLPRLLERGGAWRTTVGYVPCFCRGAGIYSKFTLKRSHR